MQRHAAGAKLGDLAGRSSKTSIMNPMSIIPVIPRSKIGGELLEVSRGQGFYRKDGESSFQD
jgi:hypothetical protein